MTGRLFVVDDDRVFTDYLATWLGSRGLAVDVFHSGAALLEGLQGGVTPHVVLLDVLMPDLNGLETLRRIRQLHPGAQVIMLSGRNAPATVIEAVRLGAADYVLKPDDADGVGEAALESAINHALERESLTSEVARLGAQLAEDPDGTQPCWSAGTAMQRVMSMVERVADSDVDVLLRGESGVGKEVIARELHRRSLRRARPWVKVNCAALPADLLESELFGHERGAFTGAGQTRIGKFEFATLGTIMLDEIGEMPVALQAKILHVLQDRTLTRLGSNRPIDVDVRVIAATNRDLESMMHAGTFREDLYYRLQVIELYIPPLRERLDEIEPLVEFFLTKYASIYRRPPVRPTAELVQALQAYHWPGNIRELENMVKRLVVLQDQQIILSELARLQRGRQATDASSHADLAPALEIPVAQPMPHDSPPVGLHAVARAAAMKAERAAIEDALAIFRWNRRKVADYLEVSYKTLLTKMRACGISEPSGG
jgi:two-component system response regulator AtoC